VGLRVYPPPSDTPLPSTTTAGFEWPNPGDPAFVEIPPGTGAFLTTGRKVFVDDGSHGGLMVVDTLYPESPELPGVQVVTMINRPQPSASTMLGTATITAIEAT